MKRTVAAMLILVVASLAGASVLESYRIEESDTDAQLFWHADEAYLFVGTIRLGWRESYLRCLFDYVLALARVGVPPQDSKSSIAVFRITPTGVERHVVDNMKMPPFAVIDDHINSGKWRWNGDRFEPATADEGRRWVAKMPPLEFSRIDGWSKRSFLPIKAPADGRRLPFELGGQPVVLTVYGESLFAITLDLQRPNRSPERLFSLNERPRFASKAEYDAFFNR